MQVRVGVDGVARQQAGTRQRIKTALGSVEANVMLADIDLNIV